MLSNNFSKDTRKPSAESDGDDDDCDWTTLMPLFADIDIDEPQKTFRKPTYPNPVPWFSDNPDLSDQIINFDRALTYTSPKGITMFVHRLSEDTWTNLQWYIRSSFSQKEQLKLFMLELDRKHRVDMDDARTKDIYDGIYNITEALKLKLGHLDHRFAGTFYQMGSSHNHTKVGEPDEFDFTYELDVCKLLNHGEATIVLEGGSLLACGIDCPDKYNLFDFPEERRSDMKDARSYRSAIVRSDGQFIVNRKHAAFAFFLLLEKALAELDLPEGWSHGGANKPKFSGVRFNFPAYLIQLFYDGRGRFLPLTITIDVAPMLRIANKSPGKGGVLEEYFIQNDYDKRGWLPLGQGYGETTVFSYSEELLLSNYRSDSAPKTVIRVCKLIHSMAGLSSPKYLPRDLAEMASDLRADRFDRASFVWTLRRFLCNPDEVKFVSSKDELATFKDLGEKVDGFEYVTSYTFKRAVMTMLILDENKGTTWTLNDIPELVLTVYLIINDVIVALQSLLPDVSKQNNLSHVTAGGTIVSLEQYYRQNDKPTTSVRTGHNTDTLRIYYAFGQALRRDRCPNFVSLFNRIRYLIPSEINGFDSRLSGVFELLRCALELRPNATLPASIVPLSQREDEIRQNVHRYFISKKELFDMFDTK